MTAKELFSEKTLVQGVGKGPIKVKVGVILKTVPRFSGGGRVRSASQ